MVTEGAAPAARIKGPRRNEYEGPSRSFVRPGALVGLVWRAALAVELQNICESEINIEVGWSGTVESICGWEIK